MERDPIENVPSIQPTPGPWDYVPGNDNHGPYVTSEFGSTICDCYTMSNLSAPAICNGGDSKPLPFMAEMADPNARLIAAAPDLLSALKHCVIERSEWLDEARAAITKAERR